MKERMLITGGNALEGEVRVSGGKNTAVAVIPAMLLSNDPCTIENLPDIEDVHALVDILRSLGAKVIETPKESPDAPTGKPIALSSSSVIPLSSITS